MRPYEKRLGPFEKRSGIPLNPASIDATTMRPARTPGPYGQPAGVYDLKERKKPTVDLKDRPPVLVPDVVDKVGSEARRKMTRETTKKLFPKGLPSEKYDNFRETLRKMYMRQQRLNEKDYSKWTIKEAPNEKPRIDPKSIGSAIGSAVKKSVGGLMVVPTKIMNEANRPMSGPRTLKRSTEDTRNA